MFNNENESIIDKGLFTFYREQQQFEKRIARQKKYLKQQQQKQRQYVKIQKQKQHQRLQKQKSLIKSQTSSPPKPLLPIAQKTKPYQSPLQQSNKSMHKQFGSSVIVISKANHQTNEQVKKQRKNHNLRYSVDQGYFIRKKSLNLLGQIENIDNTKYQVLRSKPKIIRNNSQSQRHSKLDISIKPHEQSHCQNQLYKPKSYSQLNGQKKAQQSWSSFQQQKLLFLPQLCQRSSSKLVAIPIKKPSSILHSGNPQMIKQIRKALQQERQKYLENIPNHSYVEYNSFQYDQVKRDFRKLNYKQKRMVSLLEQFRK